VGGFFVVRFRVVMVEGLPHPTNLPPEGNPPPPHPTQVGSFLFFGDFSAFLNLSAPRKSDFLFPANIFGGNPARSLVYITPLGHGIAAGNSPIHAKTAQKAVDSLRISYKTRNILLIHARKYPKTSKI
jgi:hypothetical protein